MAVKLLCLLSVILFFNGGHGAIVAKPTLPPICATVLCAFPDCPNPIPPGPGECCSTCPKDEPPTLDCRLVLCALPDCPNPIPAGPGRCCATCPPVMTPPPPPLKCPKLPPDTFGICVERCSADDDCPQGQLCCSNGCGHVCTEGVPDVCVYNGQTYLPGESFPADDGCNTCTCSSGGLVACTKKACVTLPPPPLKCPKLPPDTFGICVERCSADDDCPKGQLCCSNGCGHECTEGVPDVCVYNGQTYLPGESFPADDGCNTCTCSSGGLVGCTEKACVCVEDGVIYNVGDSFPADDGCNTCTCVAPGDIACTEIACPPQECRQGDKVYKVGESFPAGDGCNTCSCIRPNVIVCTLIACPEPTTPPPPPPTCPPDKPPVNCLVDPCQFAKCPNHPDAVCVADYCGGCNARFFIGKKEVTDSCDCPVKGQIFNECGSACPPNCTIPNPICTRQCVARCECPAGQVIDQTKNECVRVSECPSQCPPDKPPVYCFVDPCQVTDCPNHPNSVCVADYCGGCNARFFVGKNEVTDTCNSCPPPCTAALCKKNKWAKCTIPGPREIPGCTGTCQFTFCSACYFSDEPRPLPGTCPTCGGPISSIWCFKKWAWCIRRADRAEHGPTPADQQTEERFKCYRYPCPLRG